MSTALLEGARFGRLVVSGIVGRRKNGDLVVLCICDCGTRKVVRASGLRGATTRSCGCLRREVNSKLMDQINRNRNVQR